MSFGTVLSAVLHGLDVEFITVEADLSNGLPMFHMVGYLSTDLKEASDRIRTAIRNTGMVLPTKKIIINLSPANIRKSGSSFDLPIALSIMTSLNWISQNDLGDVLVIGELGLDGSVYRCDGVLPILCEAKKRGVRACIVPAENEKEASMVQGMPILYAKTLRDVWDMLTQNHRIDTPESLQKSNSVYLPAHTLDFSEVCGQEYVKRATEVAVAGNHNLLFIGPPGSGKTMIAKRIPTILPPLTLEESMEINKVYSVAGLLKKEYPWVLERPFREVHHSITKAALIGGGMYPKPGELSLASGGVLFLDELAEFRKSVLEVLRQPLESREITLIRSGGNYTYPADVMLVAAMNPCPCGSYPDLNVCHCTPYQISQYMGKISQPFLSRLDICVFVPKMEYETLHQKGEAETSERIRNRIIHARHIQKIRYGEKQYPFNGGMTIQEIHKYCELNKEGKAFMEQSFHLFHLNARTYHKVLKVARTIADLSGQERIALEHLQEAIGYRMMDKKNWGCV